MLTFATNPLAVGAITDSSALRDTFDLAAADLVELRLDALGSGPEVIAFARKQSADLPLLITARDPGQGGANDLAPEARLALLRDLLPYAAAVDVELANLMFYEEFLAEVQSLGVKVVLSSHDFSGFDHLATLEAFALAQASGADLAKAAVTLRDPLDLALFESLLADMGTAPFSLMGMGSYGPVSRLLAAQHGSRLNYGYLGEKPTAPGQWPAPLLKAALAATPSIVGKD